MAQLHGQIFMMSLNELDRNLYSKIYEFDNLFLAWQKARKGKTRKNYVVKFEKYLERNLLDLEFELKNEFYKPLPLQTFILRDPKTRKISKSDFRDRVVHHAIVNILEPIVEKTFVFDSCANRKGKGTLFALKRFEKFRRIVTKNFSSKGFCLKADIRHYFEEVDREILLKIISKKIKDEKVLWLIEKIVTANNFCREREINEKGMPLGNLTSQFFANIYLNELDYFVKKKLWAKHYIRYVDDFVILHESKEQLEEWKEEIDNFLKEELKLELHRDKSKVILLSSGIDFVGFRNFYYFRLLRKRNVRRMFSKINKFEEKTLAYDSIIEIFEGWNAYAKWANALGLRRKVLSKINLIKLYE